MNSQQRLWKKGGAICLAFFTGWAISCGGQIESYGGPAKVEIRKTGKAYALYINNRPFYIKGAGLEGAGQESLARHGANSLRTWESDDGRSVLDRALTNGLYVTMGLRAGLERRGFDYNDTAVVNRQLEMIKDLYHHITFHHGRNEANRPAAIRARRQVDLKYSLQELGPAHPPSRR